MRRKWTPPTLGSNKKEPSNDDACFKINNNDFKILKGMDKCLKKKIEVTECLEAVDRVTSGNVLDYL